MIIVEFDCSVVVSCAYHRMYGIMLSQLGLLGITAGKYAMSLSFVQIDVHRCCFEGFSMHSNAYGSWWISTMNIRITSIIVCLSLALLRSMNAQHMICHR